MNPIKHLAEKIRGWLPKEPNSPLYRLRSMRKTVALVTATLLVTSVTLYYSFSLFSNLSTPKLPELQPVVPVPNRFAHAFRHNVPRADFRTLSGTYGAKVSIA